MLIPCCITLDFLVSNEINWFGNFFLISVISRCISSFRNFPNPPFVPMFIAYSATLIDADYFNGLVNTNSQHVLPMLVLNYMPLFAQVIFFGAVLSAIMSCSSATLLDAATGVPVDEKKAEIIYALATIRLQRSLELADYSLSNVQNILKQLDLDDLGVSIFRELICGIDLDESALAIGARHKVSRQTVSERRTRLITKILNLRENSQVMSLQTFMSSRIQNDKGIQGFSLLDPVVAISRIPNRSEFPNVVDVVLLGLWLSSADSASGTPKVLTATAGDRLVRR